MMRQMIIKKKVGQIDDDELDDDSEKGGQIADNPSMSAPTQVTIGGDYTQNTTESIASLTQGTIDASHKHNNKDTDTKNHCEEGNGGEKGDDDGDDAIASTEHLGLGYVSRHVEAVINSLSGTTYETPPCPLER